MVAFIGNTLRGKVGENPDESIAIHQNSSQLSNVKILCYTYIRTYHVINNNWKYT